MSSVHVVYTHEHSKQCWIVSHDIIWTSHYPPLMAEGTNTQNNQEASFSMSGVKLLPPAACEGPSRLFPRSSEPYRRLLHNI